MVFLIKALLLTVLLLKGDFVFLGLRVGSSEKWAKISTCLMGLHDLINEG